VGDAGCRGEIHMISCDSYLMSLVAGYCKAFERCQGNKNGFDGDGKPLF
jgi:hypothetical protein